ncbi:MAG TPA: alkaline phosphatase PhoX, partial [Trichocoleus sp.]
MSLKRRQFLMFLGATAGTVSLGSLTNGSQSGEPWRTQVASASSELAFKPVKSPMPVTSMGIAQDKQVSEYSRFVVQDDLVLPEGYTYDIIAAWGDAVGDSHFGYNNDYISLVETKPGEGYLTVNFEYISATAWMDAYETVMGRALPLEDVKAAVEAAGEDGIDAFALSAINPLKAKILTVCEAALTDLGIGVIAVRRDAEGRWVRT